MLTIVTASHRNVSGLRELGNEIFPHLGVGICWIVKDSGQCEETRQWALSQFASYPDFLFDDSMDHGLYDALNRAISRVRTKYYLVVGSDDMVDGAAVLEADRISNRLAHESGRSDVITFPVKTTAGLWRRKRFRPLWVSTSSLFTTHSVGTLIRRDLHDSLGHYDTTYRILADSLFLRRAWTSGAKFDHHEWPVLGKFSLGGVSSRNHGRRIVETYSYMVSTGSPRWIQAGLLCLRLARYLPTSLL